MNTTKIEFGWPIIAILGGAVFALITFTDSYSRSIEPSSFRSFTVSAEGESVGIPDIARFNFTVLTEGGIDIASLQKENTDKANSAVDSIKSQGVKPEDIKTTTYDLTPRYQYFNCFDRTEVGKPCPPPEIVGYTIRQSVGIKIRDFSKIGGIISEVVQSGVNDISSLQFAIDDPASLENEARTKAIEKAKERAKIIAKSGGFSLGKLISVEEGSNRLYPPYALSKTAEDFDFGIGGAEPQIEPGSEEIKVFITLKYEIR